MPGPGSELDRREREILKVLVQDYIQTGDPVASRPLLARHDGPDNRDKAEYVVDTDGLTIAEGPGQTTA